MRGALSWRRLGGLCLLLLAVPLFLSATQAWAGSWKRASDRHERDCNAWCEANEECDHCSTLRYCGKGFDTMRSWDGYGKNWHACKRRPSYTAAGRQHEEECQRWCEANPGCEKCLMSAGCGPGYTQMRAWRGRGHNWYACGRRNYRNQASNNNRDDCMAWCDAEPACRSCKTLRHCGSMVALRHWTGRGRNWHACGVRAEVEAWREATCRRWCGEREECVRCSSTSGCGYGYLVMKTWGGQGKNWHACKRRDSAWGSVGGD